MEWALLLLLFLYWDGNGDVVAGADDVLRTITQGPRVTDAPYDPTTGVVPYDPNALANQAGSSLSTYALARMISSEEGTSDNTTKAAVAWTALNYAAQKGQDIGSILLHAVDPNHSGYFGTFKNIDPSSATYKVSPTTGKPSAADRYASTALDPYQGDMDIATAVTSGQIPDFTSGATQFDRPGGERNPAAIASKRIAAGSVQVNVPGVDPGLRFWAPAVG